MEGLQSDKRRAPILTSEAERELGALFYQWAWETCLKKPTGIHIGGIQLCPDEKTFYGTLKRGVAEGCRMVRTPDPAASDHAVGDTTIKKEDDGNVISVGSL